MPPGSWKGLGGTTPVFANLGGPPGIDGRDPARAGGDAFDLAVLREHPLVKVGKVNLAWITQVRLVDIVDGTQKDSRGRLIRDPSFGSADIDAVAVLQFLSTDSLHAPEALLDLTAARELRLVLRDPDGFADLDPSQLHMSLQGLPLDFFAILGIFRVVSADNRGFVLVSLFPLPPDLPIKMSFSIRDRAGLLGGSTVVLH